MLKPTLCLTIGDPAGIGPEITAKLLQIPQLQEQYRFIVIGNISHLEKTSQALGIPLETLAIGVDFINIPGNVDRESGAIAYMALEKAIELLRAGKAAALVTGPISKENLKKSGIPFSGHTEILQHLAENYYKESYQADMLFLYQAFRMLLLTRHIPLRTVGNSLTIEGTARSLENTVRFLRERLHIEQPRLCILGVNPHGGEIGGTEEREILLPAIVAISHRHNLQIDLPVAADAVFRGFNPNEIPYDAYIAAYHDQGLIPFKMVAGMRAVNVTIGLPFLRTSVSHGTAPDIVGRGIADPTSLMEAVRLAGQLINTPDKLSASGISTSRTAFETSNRWSK